MAVNELIQKTNEIFVKVQSVMEKMDYFATVNQFEQFKIEDNCASQLLNEALLNCDRLEILSRKEPIANRSNSKLRVDQLRYDMRHFQSAIRNIQNKMNQKNEEAHERELLMSTSFVSNRNSSVEGDRTKILIEHGLEEHKRLSSSVNHMNRLIESGSTILNSLTDQRDSLKSAHRHMLSMLTTLGLSQTVMRMIERRSSQDWIIFCIGCFLILCLLFLLWKFIV